MKAIRIFEDTFACGDHLSLPRLRLYADSAIGRDVMPLFIPDNPEEWMARICVSVRINRLGKGISPKFAMRYVDAVSLTALLLPGTDAAAWDRSGVLSVLDSAVTTGLWHELNMGAIQSVAVTAAGEGRTFTASDLDIGSLVSTASRFATLRTGDILIIDSTGIDLPLTRGTTLEAAINTLPCLNLKIR